MRLALTGTPGTGKTTASERLDVSVVHLNEAVEERGLWTDRDAERDSLVVDLDAVAEWLADREDVVAAADPETHAVVESHLAHLLDADRVAVLRCRPAVLESRLRDRGESAAKATENAESEALDVILSEAVERHGAGNVYEIDATDRSPDEVAAAVRGVLDGEREPSAGAVDFTDYL